MWRYCIKTRVGNFDLENSITIEDLEYNKDNEDWINNYFITIEKFFEKSANKISLNERKLQLFLNGVQLSYQLEEGLYRIYDEKNKFIGIGLVKNNLLKREIIVENENKIW